MGGVGLARAMRNRKRGTPSVRHDRASCLRLRRFLLRLPLSSPGWRRSSGPGLLDRARGNGVWEKIQSPGGPASFRSAERDLGRQHRAVSWVDAPRRVPAGFRCGWCQRWTKGGLFASFCGGATSRVAMQYTKEDLAARGGVVGPISVLRAKSRTARQRIFGQLRKPLWHKGHMHEAM